MCPIPTVDIQFKSYSSRLYTRQALRRDHISPGSCMKKKDRSRLTPRDQGSGIPSMALLMCGRRAYSCSIQRNYHRLSVCGLSRPFRQMRQSLNCSGRAEDDLDYYQATIQMWRFSSGNLANMQLASTSVQNTQTRRVSRLAHFRDTGLMIGYLFTSFILVHM